MNKLINSVKRNGQVENIIQGTFQGVLCMADGDLPYALPINHAYKDGKFYFHCGAMGRKLEIIHRNPNVTYIISKYYGEASDFEKSLKCHGLWESVIAYGKAKIISEKEELLSTFSTFMAYYGKGNFEPSETFFETTRAIVIEVDKMTVRREDQDGKTDYWVWEKE